MGIHLLTDDQRLRRQEIPDLIDTFSARYKEYISQHPNMDGISWSHMEVLLKRLPSRIDRQIETFKLSIIREDQTEIVLSNNQVSCLNQSHTVLSRLIDHLEDPPINEDMARLRLYEQLSMLLQVASETLSEFREAYSYLDLAFEIAISEFPHNEEILDELAHLYEWSYTGILDSGIDPIIFVDLCNRSLHLREKSGNYRKISSNLLTLAELFFVMDNLPAAIYHYQRLITLPDYDDFSVFTKVHHRMMYIYTLSFTDDMKKAERLLHEINQLIESLPDTEKPFFTSENIKHKQILSEALLLKMSSRFRDKYRAESMLSRLLSDEFLSSDIRQIATKTLIKLLLTEFEYTGEKVVLDEIQQLIQYLPETQHNIFHARLIFLDGDSTGALHILRAKKNDATKMGNMILAKEIDEEINHIQDTIKKWEDNLGDQISVSQKIRDLKFTHYVKYAKNFESHLRGMRTNYNEEPMIIMIIGLGGNLRYHFTFAQEGEINEHLLSSFLVAIDQFGSEALSGNIDRIYQGEFTISIKNIDSLNFCYVYKGFSADYEERIEKIIGEISSDHHFWTRLKDTDYLLVSDFKERLDHIILDNFQLNEKG